VQRCGFIVVGLGDGVWNVVLSSRKDLWVQKGGLDDKLLCSLVRYFELTVFFIYLISTYLLYIVIPNTSLFIAIADLCSTICCTWRDLVLLWSHKWLPEEGGKLIRTCYVLYMIIGRCRSTGIDLQSPAIVREDLADCSISGPPIFPQSNPQPVFVLLGHHSFSLRRILAALLGKATGRVLTAVFGCDSHTAVTLWKAQMKIVLLEKCANIRVLCKIYTLLWRV
jgi:hypothetical protein